MQLPPVDVGAIAGSLLKPLIEARRARHHPCPPMMRCVQPGAPACPPGNAAPQLQSHCWVRLSLALVRWVRLRSVELGLSWAEFC